MKKTKYKVKKLEENKYILVKHTIEEIVEELPQHECHTRRSAEGVVKKLKYEETNK